MDVLQKDTRTDLQISLTKVIAIFNKRRLNNYHLIPFNIIRMALCTFVAEFSIIFGNSPPFPIFLIEKSRISNNWA